MANRNGDRPRTSRRKRRFIEWADRIDIAWFDSLPYASTNMHRGAPLSARTIFIVGASVMIGIVGIYFLANH
jgi:hypothetical protein